MATAEIASVQFAKVGQKREKKRGGVPLSWGGGARGGGSFIGALGGSGISGGSGGLLAQILPKFLMATIILSLGAGTYGLKLALAPQSPIPQRPKKVFDSAPKGRQHYDGDTSNLPGSDRAQSGLNMVQGGLYGDASAQAGQAGQSDKAGSSDKSGQDTAGQSGKSGKDAAATPDANAVAAAVAGAAGGAGAAGKNGSFASRFGSLSQGFGGGSSSFGSGGMFGGVGRAFDTGKLTSPFSSPAAPGRAQAQASPQARNPATRLAARQLNSAVLGGRAAQGALNSESAGYSASRPFDGQNLGAGGGGQIQGPMGGASNGAGTTIPGDPNSNSGGGANPSGPTAGGVAGQEGPNPSDCVQLLGPNYFNSASGGCVQSVAGTDATPWGPLVKMAAMLLLMAGVVILIASILFKMAMAAAGAVDGMWHAAIILAKIGAALGGIAALLGAAIMAQGQVWQGMMFMVPGGLIAAAGILMAMHGAPVQGTYVMPTWLMYGGMISGAMGGMAGLSGAAQGGGLH